MNLYRSFEGKRTSATEENARARAIRRSEIKGGPGVRVNCGANGTTITAVARSDTRRVATKSHPWKVTLSGGSLTVAAGTLNGATVAEATLSSGEGWVALKVTSNLSTGEVTATSIEFVTDLTATSGTSRHAYCPLAAIAADGTITQLRVWHLSYATAGNYDFFQP